MPVIAHADYGAVRHIERREQGGRSVSLVVVGHSSAAALLQRQSWLRTIQRLVAVGMPVTRHPPHRSPRAAFPHEAPILDGWRQSELRGKDERHAAAEAIDQPGFASVSTAGDVAGSDGSKWSARAG